MSETDTKREGWVADELGEESSYEGKTEAQRRIRRGDESLGDPDDRDVAGSHEPKQQSDRDNRIAS